MPTPDPNTMAQALRFAISALTQPVQDTRPDTINDLSRLCGTVAILQGDARAVVDRARAALDEPANHAGLAPRTLTEAERNEAAGWADAFRELAELKAGATTGQALTVYDPTLAEKLNALDFGALAAFLQGIAPTPAKNGPMDTTDPVAGIPPNVRRRISIALENLRFVANEMANARTQLDENLQGGGRYEADVLTNNADPIARAQATITEFRARAAEKKIEAEAVITALGGLADLTPSPGAAQWIADDKANQTERTYKGWLTTCADSADKLRTCDLDRVLGYALEGDDLAGFSAWLTKARPDLSGPIRSVSDELMAEA